MSEPTPDPAPADVPGGDQGGELVDAVMTASRVLVAIAARSLAEVGEVTLPQYRALVVLATRGPHRGTDLAEALGVNPSSATRLIERLSRAGLIRRTRLRADRRAVRVALTPQGRDLVAQVTQRRRREVEQLLEALPAEQHQQVITALHAIADAAGEAPERDLSVGLGW